MDHSQLRAGHMGCWEAETSIPVNSHRADVSPENNGRLKIEYDDAERWVKSVKHPVPHVGAA